MLRSSIEREMEHILRQLAPMVLQSPVVGARRKPQENAMLTSREVSKSGRGGGIGNTLLDVSERS